MNLYENLTTAYQRLVSFSRLEFNWDSVGANKIDQQAIDNSSYFLNYLVNIFTPSEVNPLPNGRVEMRWKGSEYELSLEFTRKSRVVYNLLPLKEGLCFKQGVAESAEECLQLFLICFRPEAPERELKPSCKSEWRKPLPY